MNEEWTAVLVERWDVLDETRLKPTELKGALVDLVGVGPVVLTSSSAQLLTRSF